MTGGTNSSRSFLEVWRTVAIRHGRTIPAWHDFSAAELAPFAGLLLLQDLSDPDNLRTRFAGPSLERAIGPYNTQEGGNRMSEADRLTLDPFRLISLRHPCGVEVLREIEEPCAEGGINRATSLMLPVSDRRGETSYLVVVTTMDYPIVGNGNGVDYEIVHASYVDIGFGVPGPDVAIHRRLHVRLDGQRFIDE